MNGNKIIGNVLMAGGVLLVLVAVTADLTSLGEGSAFGWKQLTGVVIGVLDVVAGVWINNRPEPPAA